MHTHSTTTPTVDLLTQQRFVRQLCECGEPGQVFADDDVTPLCAPCWLAIYGRDEDVDL